MGNGVDFAVEVETLHECVIVHVAGELDLASAASFDETLSAMNECDLIIDLSACTFLDSSGLRAIAAAARRHPRISVVATDPGILRVLEITALDTMVPVHASLEDAR